MKRPKKLGKPKPLTLRAEVSLLNASMGRWMSDNAGKLAELELSISRLKELTFGVEAEIKQLKDMPLSVVREVEKVLEKIQNFYVEQAANVEHIMPNIVDQFNGMAEAVNKISAYAKAMDESGESLRDLTHKRIRKLEKAEDTDAQLLAKLKHRLKRMEQKL